MTEPEWVQELSTIAARYEPRLRWLTKYLPVDLYRGQTEPELYLAWHLDHTDGHEYGIARQLPVRPHTQAEIAVLVRTMTALAPII